MPPSMNAHLEGVRSGEHICGVHAKPCQETHLLYLHSSLLQYIAQYIAQCIAQYIA